MKKPGKQLTKITKNIHRITQTIIALVMVFCLCLCTFAEEIPFAEIDQNQVILRSGTAKMIFSSPTKVVPQQKFNMDVTLNIQGSGDIIGFSLFVGYDAALLTPDLSNVVYNQTIPTASINSQLSAQNTVVGGKNYILLFYDAKETDKFTPTDNMKLVSIPFTAKTTGMAAFTDIIGDEQKVIRDTNGVESDVVTLGKPVTCNTTVATPATLGNFKVNNENMGPNFVYFDHITPTVDFSDTGFHQQKLFYATGNDQNLLQWQEQPLQFTTNASHKIWAKAVFGDLTTQIISQTFVVEKFDGNLLTPISASETSLKAGSEMTFTVKFNPGNTLVAGSPNLSFDILYPAEYFTYISSQTPNTASNFTTVTQTDGKVTFNYNTNGSQSYDQNIRDQIDPLLTIKFRVDTNGADKVTSQIEMRNFQASRHILSTQGISAPNFSWTKPQPISVTIRSAGMCEPPKLKAKRGNAITVNATVYGEVYSVDSAGLSDFSNGTFKNIALYLGTAPDPDATYSIAYKVNDSVYSDYAEGTTLSAVGNYVVVVTARKATLKTSTVSYKFSITADPFVPSVNGDNFYNLVDYATVRASILNDNSILERISGFSGGVFSGDVTGNFLYDDNDVKLLMELIRNNVQSADYGKFLPIYK